MSKVFVTGRPGVGKTTVIKKAIQLLEKDASISLHGFYTIEVSNTQGYGRLGFDIVSITNAQNRAPLARNDNSIISSHHVGRYTVDLKSFEAMIPSILPQFAHSSNSAGDLKHVVIIDEIGKMEMLSKKFLEAVTLLFSREDIHILATIPLKREQFPFIEQLTRQASVAAIVEVNERNRNSIVHEIVAPIMMKKSA